MKFYYFFLILFTPILGASQEFGLADAVQYGIENSNAVKIKQVAFPFLYQFIVLKINGNFHLDLTIVLQAVGKAIVGLLLLSKPLVPRRRTGIVRPGSIDLNRHLFPERTAVFQFEAIKVLIQY